MQEATFGLAHHVRDEISQVGSRVDPTAKGSQDGTRRPDGREALAPDVADDDTDALRGIGRLIEVAADTSLLGG